MRNLRFRLISLVCIGIGVLAAVLLVSGFPGGTPASAAQTITICKVTSPSNASQSFQFNWNAFSSGPQPSFFLMGGGCDPKDVTSLDKHDAFTEIVPSGWSLTNIACNNGPNTPTWITPGILQPGDPNRNTTFEPGDDTVEMDLNVANVTCTFTNSCSPVAPCPTITPTPTCPPGVNCTPTPSPSPTPTCTPNAAGGGCGTPTPTPTCTPNPLTNLCVTPTPSPEVTPTCTPAAGSNNCGTPTPTPTCTPNAAGLPCAPTPAPTHTPILTSPTPTRRQRPILVGNVDCSVAIDSVDSLKLLRFIAMLPVMQTMPCPMIGSAVDGFGITLTITFGDVDCDNDVDSVDALKILRFVAALDVTQNEPCPDIGTPEGG